MARLAVKKIDEFQDIDYVTSGGFGHIYKAIHAPTGQNVAVKQLESSSRNPLDKSDFEREASILQGVSPSDWFPNFVKTWQQDPNDDFSLFLAMEWIEGDTVDEAIKNNSLNNTLPDPKDWLEFMISALEGLEYIHTPNSTKIREWKNPIIHRDIKPKNVKITPQKRAVILDIGAGRFLVQDASGTTVREVTSRVATGVWEAPESQIYNKVYPISDIYSLGLTLYAWLTGEIPVMPFMLSRENLDPSSDYYDMNPARYPMSSWNSKIDQDFENIIYQMCCLKRDERFSTARKAIETLEDWGGLSPQSQRQPQKITTDRQQVVQRRPVSQQQTSTPSTPTSPAVQQSRRTVVPPVSHVSQRPTRTPRVRPITPTQPAATIEYKICSNCGSVIQDQTCDACGATWNGKKTDKICSDCNLWIPKNLCVKCGKAV